MSNSFIMTESIVRPAKMPYGRLKDNGFVGIEGEHAARALVVETKDDLSAFASINLIIDDLDCGAMTKTTSGGTTTLSMTLTSSMIGRSGRKICQLIMVNSGNTVVQKSSQFEAYVGRANEIERSVDDGVTIIILSEAVTEMAREAAAAAAEEAVADVVEDCQEIANAAAGSARDAAQSAQEAEEAAASIVVDATLDPTSTHAIQNKAVASEISSIKADLGAQLDAHYNNFRLTGFSYGHTNTETGVIDNTKKWLTKDYIYHNDDRIYLYVAPSFKAEILYYDSLGVITGHISNIYSARVISADSYFKLSVGYRDAREMTALEVEECMKNIFVLSTSQQEIFKYINKEHSITKSLLYGGSFNPPLEIGGVNADTDALMSQYDRFRTVDGHKYRAYKGDTITLSDFTTYRLYVRMFLLDGSYTTSNWQTEPYTIPYDCYFYVLVQRIDGENLTTDDLKLSNSLVTCTTAGIYGDAGKDVVRKGAFSSTTGAYAFSEKRLCNTNYLKYPYPVRVKVADGYAAYISTYKDDETHTFLGYYQVVNNDMSISANTVFRWYARTNNSDPITIDEIANYTDIITIINDEYNGLTQYGDFFTLSLFESVGILGDSYASGAMHHIEDSEVVTVNYGLSWGQILARKHGFVATNYTHGGRSTKTWLTDNDYGLPALLADTPKNLYIVNFGINDRTAISNGTLDMGTIADCTADYDNNPVSFYGCYGRIIGNVQNHAPNAKIIILSVARFAERADMDSHIQEIAEHFGIPFIYLPDDDYFTSKYFYDSIFGNHPLSYGYAGMAEAIDRLITKYFTSNPTYLRSYYGLTTS